MRVVALRLQTARKQPMQQRDSLLLLAGKGIDGDCHQGGMQQVSLLPLDAERRVIELGRPGLCMKRFTANIVVDGLQSLMKGARLRVGAAILDVTQMGKHCYAEECDYAFKPCPLQGCAYAAVLRGGMVSIGDGVWLETKSTLR